MITKLEAIQMGKQITKMSTEARTENNLVYRGIMRGTCIIILDNMWYNVFDAKLKSKFNNRKDDFYTSSEWS